MQQSINLNDLLEQWEKIKNCSVPTPCTLNEALEFTRYKIELNKLADHIRSDRFNSSISLKDAQQFVSLYDSFSREYVYRILKNG